MADKNSIFSKRKNQLGSLKNKNGESSTHEDNQNKEFLEEEDIINDILTEDSDDSQTTTQKSMLDMLFDEDSKNLSSEDIDVFSKDVEESTPEINIDDAIDIDSDDIIEDVVDEIQISIEDDSKDDINFNDEPNLMDDMLSSLDSELQNQQEEDFSMSMDETRNAIDDAFGDNDPEEDPEDEGAYSEAEINSRRKKVTIAKNKDFLIKIGVAIAALIIIGGAAFGLNKFINKDLNSSSNPGESSNTSTFTEDVDPVKKPTSSSIVDDLIGDSTTIDSTIGSNNQPSNSGGSYQAPNNNDDDGSILKTYKGYIIDIKEDTFYLANLTYDKYQFLQYAWQEFKQIDESLVNVWVDEESGTYHKENCPDFEEAIIETNDDNENNEEDENSSSENGESNEEVKKGTLKATKMTLKEAKENSYTAGNCASEITGNSSVDPKDFDYDQYEELRGTIYKSMVITSSSNILLDRVEIGVEATATYIEDPDSKINELIEIKDSSKSSFFGGQESESNGNNGNENEGTSGFVSSSNVWGAEWDAIVATINDRRQREEANKEGDNLFNANGELVLQGVEKYESVSTTIEIGSASIVWFKISWKKNSDVSDVPNVSDVAVELLTPNQSLINGENISNYGKMWLDETGGVVNIVLRNTTAGEYGVVFTKEVGTYLGDVEIKAIPITGLMEIQNASAVYTNGRLEVIWNAVGVADDNIIVEVYAINGKKNVLLYSANSLDDGIHTVDMASINVSKIAGNTYDILIRVTDIDISASKPYKIIATYLSDSMTFKNIDIPSSAK